MKNYTVKLIYIVNVIAADTDEAYDMAPEEVNICDYEEAEILNEGPFLAD